jgi:DNA-binding CsgD family transcriptional regulator
VASKLTQRQQRLLFTLLRDAERGERADINENTRKAGLRRILRRTGHANFEELRRALKLLARGAVIAGLWLPHE